MLKRFEKRCGAYRYPSFLDGLKRVAAFPEVSFKEIRNSDSEYSPSERLRFWEQEALLFLPDRVTCYPQVVGPTV